MSLAFPRAKNRKIGHRTASAAIPGSLFPEFLLRIFNLLGKPLPESLAFHHGNLVRKPQDKATDAFE